MTTPQDRYVADSDFRGIAFKLLHDLDGAVTHVSRSIGWLSRCFVAIGIACRLASALYRRLMTDADRIEALLKIVDDTRREIRDESEKLVVLGLAERRGKSGFWPTNAGWNLMGDQGRAYNNLRNRGQTAFSG